MRSDGEEQEQEWVEWTDEDKRRISEIQRRWEQLDEQLKRRQQQRGESGADEGEGSGDE